MRVSSLSLSGLLLPSLLSLSCSSKGELSCGEGTKQDGDECVALGDGGAGGGDPQIVIIDRDGRSDDQKRIDAEFKGAIAAAPVSATEALVVWASLDVVGLTYNVYVATDEGAISFGTPQHTAPEGASSFEITGLDEGGEYFIAVTAVLDGFEFEVGRDAVHVQLEDDGEGPAFTGLKKGKPAGSAAVELEWDPATDDKSPSQTLRYYVYYGEEADFPEDEKSPELAVPVAIAAPGATSVVVKGLPEADTEYFFLVRARDAAGNFDDNTAVKAVITGADTVAPTFSGCDTADAASASAVNVTWQEATDDVAAAEDMVYNFYVSEEPGQQNFSEPHFSVIGGTSAQIPNLERSQKYYVVCRAADPSGNEEENERAQSATTKADGEPPEFGGVTATANLAANSIDVQWSEAEDNQSAVEKIGYLVYLSEESGDFDLEDEPYVRVVGVNAATLSDLASNTTYYMVVIAEDEAGNRTEPGAETTFTTLVSLRSDIEIPIYANKCAIANCHAGAGALFGLNLSLGWSYDKTVNVPGESYAALETGALRIVPGDPDASHLVTRISAASDSPIVMPPVTQGDFLSQGEIDTIRAWITQGAINN